MIIVYELFSQAFTNLKNNSRKACLKFQVGIDNMKDKTKEII